MGTLLIRLFIGEGADTADARVRERYGVLAGIVGIAANILLSALKFVIGAFSGSVAVQADAVNNLADVGSNMVTLLGSKLAAKPATKEHPYGHARMEYIAALIIAILIVSVGISLAGESAGRIFSPAPVEFSLLSMALLLLSIAVKLCLGCFTARIGRITDSATMAAATTDSIMDCVSTGAILVSTVTAHVFDINIDGYIGLAVAVLVIFAGIKLVRETVSPLLGEAPRPEVVQELERRILAHDEVLGVHDILVHSYGPGMTIASAHAEVDAKGDLLGLHELIDSIENEVAAAMSMLLTLHMDPVVLDDPETDRAKETVRSILDGIGGVRFHDFRMVPGEKRNNLIFDIVVPSGTQPEQAAEIVERIRKEAAERDRRYCCIIRVDVDYIGVD